MAEPVITYLKHEEVAMSGQNTVASAGTAEALGSQVLGCALRVKALTTNTGLVYVGNDGADDVSSSNGFPLSAGQDVIFAYVGNLSDIYIDSAVNSEGVAWLALEVK
jgi:hypothetical protein